MGIVPDLERWLFVHDLLSHPHGKFLKFEVASIRKDGLEALGRRQLFNGFGVALLLGDIFSRNPFAGHCLLHLLLVTLHLCLVQVQQILAGLLKQNVVVALPRALNVDLSHELIE